jgi:hypothetical protein
MITRNPTDIALNPINILLSPESNVSAMVDFSQKSREFGLFQKKSLTMIHFDLESLSSDNDGSGKSRSRLGMLKKHASNHGIIVERLDMTSSYGNSILNSLVHHNPNVSTKAVSQKYLRASTRMSISADDRMAKKAKDNVEPSVFITAFLRYSEETSVTPVMAAHNFNFIWLPRFSIADIISDTELESQMVITTGLTVREAAGVLFDELEKTMIWVLTNWKVLDNLKPPGFTECGVVSKLTFRSCTCVIAIWKFSMFLGCAQREALGRSGLWSACLEGISSWQLLRLMSKINDILYFDWSIFQGHGRRGVNATVVSLLADDRFIRAVYLIVEVLSGLYQEERYVSNVLVMQTSAVESDSARTTAAHQSRTPRPPTTTKSQSPVKLLRPRREKVKHLSEEEIIAADTVAQMQDCRRFVTSHKINIAERDRLVSSIAMYLAELIVQVCDPPVEIRSAESMSSNVINIPAGENAHFPDIWPDNCDIHIGPMNPQEMCVAMLRWSLDGRVSTQEEIRALRKKFRRLLWKYRDTIKVLSTIWDLNISM